jgi:hypothetical protein
MHCSLLLDMQIACVGDSVLSMPLAALKTQIPESYSYTWNLRDLRRVPCASWRRLEQQRQELPGGVPQHERSRQRLEQQRLALVRSSGLPQQWWIRPGL